jgi:hypothetical protein
MPVVLHMGAPAAAPAARPIVTVAQPVQAPPVAAAAAEQALPAADPFAAALGADRTLDSQVAAAAAAGGVVQTLAAEPTADARIRALCDQIRREHGAAWGADQRRSFEAWAEAQLAFMAALGHDADWRLLQDKGGARLYTAAADGTVRTRQEGGSGGG